MTTIHQALQRAQKALSQLPQANPELEAALLLCHILDRPRSHLFAWPEQELPHEIHQRYLGLVERRLAQEPIAYIIGQKEFWSLALQVNPHTLIPRPETELLVERALHHLRQIAHPRIADLGTGSGAIALALASERPDAEIVATDISPMALAKANENARALGYDQVNFFLGDWCDALPEGKHYDLILSNPPYIETSDPHLQQGDLPHEPVQALVSGSDGLDAIRTIIRQVVAGPLSAAGWLLLEHGYQQAQAVQALLQSAGCFVHIATHADLAGHPRVTEGQFLSTGKEEHNQT